MYAGIEHVLENYPESLELFETLRAIVKTSEKRRDKFAHHRWGISADLPDALLLIDPRDEFAKDPGGLFEKVFVYTEQDFTKIIEANERLALLAVQLRNSVLTF